MTEGLNSIGIFLIIGLVYFAVKKAKEASELKKLKELTAWSVTFNSSVYRFNLSLHEHISNVQVELNIPLKYTITDDEWETAK